MIQERRTKAKSSPLVYHGVFAIAPLKIDNYSQSFIDDL